MANLLVNSHYPTPWIIYKTNYSITVPAKTTRRDVAVPHGLPFRPLLVGQWSDNPNFSPSYDISLGYTQRSQSDRFEIVVLVESDETNLYFFVLNNTTSSKTVNLRLMGFAPPEYTGEVTPVEYFSKFRYNSHYRYQQLYMAGFATADVSHNLGYIPQARVWDVIDGRCSAGSGTLTNSTLHSDNSDFSEGFYYHIYRDRLL